jgi:hypothetical protein
VRAGYGPLSGFCEHDSEPSGNNLSGKHDLLKCQMSETKLSTRLVCKEKQFIHKKKVATRKYW